ncbi:MAG: serine/threonine-protein kinase [Verrucomicrobiota bacterium]
MEEPESKPAVIDECPDCSQSIDVSNLTPFAEITCPYCNSVVRMRRTMGQYFITGMLGEGGMSQVFKATDIHLQREVALKILHQTLSLDSSLTSMFEREAKLTASILHPNVVKVYTVGRDQGYFFIAMEVIDAVSLEQMIASKGCLSEQDILRIAHDVTSGLKAAYDEGLIHRDIKPGNMLVMDEGTAKLVDFGLAVHQDGEDESEELWATPYYVPPEKLDGEADTFLGDIYSLGATLFHAAAGKPPFEANTSSMDELKEIKKQSLNLKGEAPSLSKSTLKLIEKMMAYRPEDRVESYAAILEKIEEIEEKQFGASSRERAAAKSSALPKILLGGAGFLAVAAAIAFAMVSREDSGTDEGLGISAEERVISKGDDNNTGKFLEGRDWIEAGNFRKAEPIFDELVGETGMASATRMWSLYFQGLSRLYLGRERESRESFGYIAAVPDAEGEEMDQIRDFMKQASSAFSAPLPLVDAETEFRGGELKALGLFTAGLKNWQLGQFESAVRLMNALDDSGAPAGFEWINELKSSVSVFQEDWEVINQLPNPNRKNRSELGENQKELEDAVKKLQSRGAAVRLVRSRLDRIEAIRSLEKEEREEKATEITQVAESVPEPIAEVADENELSPAEQADRSLLLASLAQANALQASTQFSEAVSLIEAVEVSSDLGRSWREELQNAYFKASEFVELISGELEEQGYEGVIRRRVGVALDAKITGANSSFFIVDLGFGPNEVSVDQFAPDWMVEAAEELLGEPVAGRGDDWQKVIFYSLATQQPEDADRLAEVYSALDETFKQRWEAISRLRSG